jgi:hypothetical protein
MRGKHISQHISITISDSKRKIRTLIGIRTPGIQIPCASPDLYTVSREMLKPEEAIKLG